MLYDYEKEELELLFHDVFSTLLASLEQINSTFSIVNDMLEKSGIQSEISTEAPPSSSFGFLSLPFLILFFGLGFMAMKFKCFKLPPLFFPAVQEKPIMIIEQELLREWQNLFQKAKLYDSLIAKQLIRSQKRRNSRRSLRTNSSSISLQNRSTTPEQITPSEIDYPQIVSTEELFKIKKRLCGCDEPAAGSELEFVRSRSPSLSPKIVCTDELLKMKQDLYEPGESFC